MDDRVSKLATPKQCEIFARNARANGREDLAKEAQKQAVLLRAREHNASTAAEKEALQAVYAYEDLLTKKNGKSTRASRTWQMIKRHGIIEAVERAVNRPTETQGYILLAEMGLEEFAFEAVILRHSGAFSREAVSISKSRMAEFKARS
ncbi:MAG: hypothetical protein WD672_07545 [Woeseia sp.]